MAISARRALDIAAGTALQIGLAILGWGGFRAYFAHPALMALTAAAVAVSVAALFAGGNISPGVREDRRNRWVLVVFAVLGLVNLYVPAWTDRMNLWTLDGDAIRWIGVALFAIGGAVRLWPVHVLGYRFSGLVAIQPGHRLVTDGIYGTIRHPSYLGLLVNGLGWSLAFRSGAGVLLTLLFVPALLARIHAEENLLHEYFGAEYDAYRARTWRLIPKVY
ncbi:MAG TPA: isoprenylcysteine carboxylmethyltransferase family protein [Rhizomicrobium sp.]|jgi:protein-S-isoprenylcysteine O-methyltransferase Ste14